MRSKLALLLLSFSSFALSETVPGHFTVSAAYGVSEFDIEREYLLEEDDYDESANAYGEILAGFIFTNGLVLEAGFISQAGIDLFGANDSYDVFESVVEVGYTFGNDKFKITPKIGYSFWDLEVKEGEFLNPGPEERRESDGSDPYLKLSAEYYWTESFAGSLFYRHSDYDFGNINTWGLGLRYVFN